MQHITACLRLAGFGRAGGCPRMSRPGCGATGLVPPRCVSSARTAACSVEAPGPSLAKCASARMSSAIDMSRTFGCDAGPVFSDQKFSHSSIMLEAQLGALQPLLPYSSGCASSLPSEPHCNPLQYSPRDYRRPSKQRAAQYLHGSIRPLHTALTPIESCLIRVHTDARATSSPNDYRRVGRGRENV